MSAWPKSRDPCLSHDYAELDGLIVTGTEPKAANLVDEPYWAAFSQLVDWASHNTISTIWSCLAAHAAVLHLDRIERVPLREKCIGIFDCDKLADHPLTANLPPRLAIPHSRWNELSEAALLANGYQVLTRSAAAGIEAFVRQEQSLFLFFPGHPEYGASPLAERIPPRRGPRSQRRTRPVSGDAAALCRCRDRSRARRVPRASRGPAPRGTAGGAPGWVGGGIQ
jgi:Homoserine O-succinyltransferase